MTKVFFKVAAILVLLFSGMFSINAQQIQVGAVIDGAPALHMDDATLTSTFSFILDGAILSNARIKSATTEQGGLFYYIWADGRRNNKSLSVALILSENKNILFFDRTTGCSMECIQDYCNNCKHEIITPCREQRCNCAIQTTGCTSRVTF